jgi:hypothetical protein
MPSSVSRFNESLYRGFYNDLDAVIPSQFADGITHFQQVGRFFGPNKKEGFFTGNAGNNIITGFGDDIDMYGVNITATFTPGSGANGPVVFTPDSFGVGEKDILVGRNSSLYEDGFFLSVLNGSYSRTGASTGMLFGNSQPLYVGRGNQDFARVVNFNEEYDYVSLSGPAKDYVYRYRADSQAPDGYSLRISTKVKNDLVGIVEGINDVQPRNFLADNTFRLSGRVPARGFNDAVYDKINNVVSGGLDNYVRDGQFKGKTGVFSGAPTGSSTTNGSPITSGNDTLIAYGARGNRTIISGVGISVSGDDLIVDSNFGNGEKDTLIGSPDTRDTFWLGVGTDINPSGSRAFYSNGGNNDFARVQNYQSRDRVLLAGERNDYGYFFTGGNVEIINTTGSSNELIGVVEGVTGIASSVYNSMTDTTLMAFSVAV